MSEHSDINVLVWHLFCWSGREGEQEGDEEEDERGKGRSWGKEEEEKILLVVCLLAAIHKFCTVIHCFQFT